MLALCKQILYTVTVVRGLKSAAKISLKVHNKAGCKQTYFVGSVQGNKYQSIFVFWTFCLCLFVSLSLNISLCFCLSVSIFLSLSFCLCFCLCLSVSFCLSFCLYPSASVFLSFSFCAAAFVSVYLSFWLCLTVSVSICLFFVFLSLSIYLSSNLSVRYSTGPVL